MMLERLADGATTKALGLLPDEGFWLAVILIGLAIVLDLLVFKSIRDRHVLEKKPVVGATIMLVIISLLCFVAGVLIFLH